MKKQCGFCECDLEMNEMEEATEEGLCDHCYYEWSGQGNLMERRWAEHEELATMAQGGPF